MDSHLPTAVAGAYTARWKEDDENREDDETKAAGGGERQAHFAEAAETIAIVQALCSAVDVNGTSGEGSGGSEMGLDMSFDRVRLTLEKYQELPHLLDPYLEQLTVPVVEHLRRCVSHSDRVTLASNPAFQRLPKYLYYLMKVRGYKVIVRLFSHEASDLEPVFGFLSDLEAAKVDSWETRYVLLLWLSIIVMIPFDLKVIDSSAVRSSEESLVSRMVAFSKRYMDSTGRDYEAAAVFLMRLLTRRDVQAELDGFLKWATSDGVQSDDVFQLRGVLYTLCMLYKHGSRQAILPTLPNVFPVICGEMAASGGSKHEKLRNSALLRKLVVKITQRMGLCYLKPRVAKWRYQRGFRSLSANLVPQKAKSSVPEHRKDLLEDDDDDDVPEEIEEIIDVMLSGLSDRDTVVRWSAAKGIGRLVDRLPWDLAQQVVQSVLDTFAENVFQIPGTESEEEGPKLDLSGVNDAAWHGGCLAIAELARRGCLLPDRLSEVLMWIRRAIQFDVRRGAHSVGAHVRDAACYVCWAFARAYSPEIMAPHVAGLARSLVVVTCCDREVNIRRAASAAFQENVGRQGLFPRGVDIITTADYFAVGNRRNSFLEVATQIARFDEYRPHIIQHLSQFSVLHWDRAVRELAAQTLHKLTYVDAPYIQEHVLQPLLKRHADTALIARHGALLAISEVILPWARLKQGLSSDGEATLLPQSTNVWWAEDELTNIMKPVSAIIPFYPSEYLDSYGSDLIRTALCGLIESLSKVGWPLDVPLDTTWWESKTSKTSKSSDTRPQLSASCWSLVETSLGRREEPVQEAAASAVRWLSRWDQVSSDTAERVVRDYLKNLDPKGSGSGNNGKFLRRGFALALGELDPNTFLMPHIGDVARGLTMATKVLPEKQLNDAESRRNAVLALGSALVSMPDPFQNAVPRELFELILEALFEGLRDYSTDSRGDVGSWVREASIRTLARLVKALAKDAVGYITPQLMTRLVGELLQQSAEKIDRVRETAGTILLELLWLDNGALATTMVANHSQFWDIFPRDSTINWLNPSDVFPLVVKCLGLPEYKRQVLTGLVVSIGGLTESLVRSSSSSLVEFLSTLPDGPVPDNTSASDLPDISHGDQNTIGDFFAVVLELLRKFKKQDRVSGPLLEMLDVLFGAGVVSRVKDPPGFIEVLYDTVRKEVSGSRDVRKLLSGINVFAGFAVLNDGEDIDDQTIGVRATSFQHMVGFLCHPFPKIRRTTAESLYVIITTAADLDTLLLKAGAGVVEDSEAQMDLAEEILLTIDWDDDISALKPVQQAFAKALKIPAPKVAWK
ncbi:tubulin folding cofactor D C terminal-domain-containing protein [Cladochytrium replicatum]|nr:tubulin folding cofactor D C terminal-domain-containing protein [Cladochytrium replicatum]